MPVYRRRETKDQAQRAWSIITSAALGRAVLLSGDAGGIIAPWLRLRGHGQ
ncbi:hypothetical protein [Alterisphingorhabdus coralli]|uniref:Uncharacterized protein n=1 Tax=Alterisphingorhabdus coralli TaxID=3071408 RepID=A0AA97I3F8_9SPHN|nr:hypothetical protein [Parasphingorhabdus sp. SCSIO 66989]WOE76760.1 hypothetical protein RB602_15350 [Parasphingorhabdus sp. SCSIO 66989]